MEEYTKRLEKYLVECGVGSRREIKMYIREGRVKVNKDLILDERIHIKEEFDLVTFDNKKLEKKILKYYMFNKIAGYITAMKDDYGNKIVKDLFPKNLNSKGIFPIGRLDKDTEGLLILTNDGDLSNFIASPENNCEKTYYIDLDREISDIDIFKLENNIVIDNYTCKKSKVKKLTKKSIELTITEGKFHQVKKMIKKINNKVIYLKRIRFCKLELKNLSPGKIKEIKKEDII